MDDETRLTMDSEALKATAGRAVDRVLREIGADPANLTEDARLSLILVWVDGWHAHVKEMRVLLEDGGLIGGVMPE